MSPGLQRKLEQLAERHEEVGRLLADPEVINDNPRFRALSREFAQLEPVAGALSELAQAQRDLDAARAMRSDPEMRELAEEEIPAAEARIAALDERLQLLLIPVDPRDEGNLFLEIRAGTGGDEAAIFAGDLFRMYARYAERQGWKLEMLSSSTGEHGGFKEVVARIEGRGQDDRVGRHRPRADARSARGPDPRIFRHPARQRVCIASAACGHLARLRQRGSDRRLAGCRRRGPSEGAGETPR